MSYDPFKLLRIEFKESHVELDSVQDTFTASEIGLFMLGVNEVLRDNTESVKIVSVGNNSLFIPILVWRMMGSEPNPIHEYSMHNLWDEGGLMYMMNYLQTTQYPFIIQNGLVSNTLKSYFPGQIAFVWYTPGVPEADPRDTYEVVRNEITLIQHALTLNFVIYCKTVIEEQRRAIEDVFPSTRYRLRRFDIAPALLVILP